MPKLAPSEMKEVSFPTPHTLHPTPSFKSEVEASYRKRISDDRRGKKWARKSIREIYTTWQFSLWDNDKCSFESQPQ
jgi:hypothetical protein